MLETLDESPQKEKLNKNNVLVCHRLDSIYEAENQKNFRKNAKVLDLLLTQFAQGHVRDHFTDGTPRAGLLSLAVDTLKRQIEPCGDTCDADFAMKCPGKIPTKAIE